MCLALTCARPAVGEIKKSKPKTKTKKIRKKAFGSEKGSDVVGGRLLLVSELNGRRAWWPEESTSDQKPDQKGAVRGGAKIA